MSTLSQSHYDLSGAGQSQSDAILAKLKEFTGKWVSLVELTQCSGSYNVKGRIYDLRARGYQISSRCHRDAASGKVHSYYMLCAPPAQMGS